MHGLERRAFIKTRKGRFKSLFFRISGRKIAFTFAGNIWRIEVSMRWGVGAVFRQADRFRDQKLWGEASEVYRKGLDRFPAAFGLWVQYGHMLKELGKLALAEEAYTKAVALKPRDADIQLQLGHLYGLMQNQDKATECYRKAAYLGSKDPHVIGFIPVKRDAALSADVLFFRGDRHRDEGRWQEAAELYEQGLSRSPGSFGYLVQLGNVLKEAGDFEAARSAYERALAIDTQNADLHLQFGHLSVKSGKVQQALEHYERAVVLGCRDQFALQAVARAGRAETVLRHALKKFLPSHRHDDFNKGNPADSFAGLILDAVSFKYGDGYKSDSGR